MFRIFFRLSIGALLCAMTGPGVIAADLHLPEQEWPHAARCCVTCAGKTEYITCAKGQSCKRGCVRYLFDFTNSSPLGPLLACFGGG